MTQEDNSTTRDDSPVFKSWNSWYLIVIIVNIIVVSLIYFIFKSI